jgi:peptidoglycan/LPS O-acetylase OafA/YrhL
MAISDQTVQVPTSGYLRTLDGWRALAVFSVIAYHDHLYRCGRFTDKWLHSQGRLGVDLFFSISGLLICSRLLDEETKTGNISLRNFYVRRTFRIFPPMLAFLAAAGVLGLLHIIHVGLGAWVASLFFLNNYYSAFRHDVAWSLYTNHFWSLAVEEHFYLLLPSLLVLYPRIRVKLLGASTLIFLLWSLAYSVIERHSLWIDYAAGRTDLRLYDLLFPALLAVLLRHARFREHVIRFCRPSTIIPIMLVAGFVGLHISHTLTYKLIVPFGFPFLILCTVLHPQSFAGKFLELRLLRGLGRISYSIYLWQQLFFIGEHSAAFGYLSFLQTGPWNLVATLVMALLSYFLLEKPFIRLGHRLAPPATPGHRDLTVVTA